MPAPVLKRDTFGRAVRDAFLHQTHIGWRNFLRGRISKRWYLALQPYYKERFPGNHPSQDSWTQTLITATLQGFNTQWITRCGILHGKDNLEQTTLLRKELMQTVTALYPTAKTRFRGEHRRLLSASPQQLTHKPLPYLRAWLLSIEKTLALYPTDDPATAPRSTHPPTPPPPPPARSPVQRRITTQGGTCHTTQTPLNTRRRRRRTGPRVRAEDAAGTPRLNNFFATRDTQSLTQLHTPIRNPIITSAATNNTDTPPTEDIQSAWPDPQLPRQRSTQDPGTSPPTHTPTYPPSDMPRTDDGTHLSSYSLPLSTSRNSLHP